MEIRLRIVGIGFGIASLVLLGRLFYWQVLQGHSLALQAKAQQISTHQLVARRGDILAQDETWLAASVDSWLLYAELPKLEQSPGEIARALAPLTYTKPIEKEVIRYEGRDVTLDDPDEEVKEATESETLAEESDDLIRAEELRLVDLISRNELVWVALKKRMSNDEKSQIEALGIIGLGFEQEEGRQYPEGTVAAQVLGFVGKDEDGYDVGYFGLEGEYELTLSGRPGFIERESDAIGKPLLFGSTREVAPAGGINLVTHIDKVFQLTIEQKLREGIAKYGAKSGNIIVMDPKTGGILAMTSWPNYDPRYYFEYTDENFKNPAISDAFEPGSIFKPIIMASGLDAGVVEPNTVCDVCDRPYQVDKYFIRTWNNEYHAGSTMVDVIKHSDNVGMAFVGSKLGSDKLYDYLEKFGFGKLTDIDLQGEVTPVLREKGSWNIVDLATTSFGQGIAVTPLQIIRAIAAIANDGVLMQPQVVDKLTAGDWESDIPPVEVHRVISADAASKMTGMMVTAVKDGEAKWTVPKGYSIAGKTGTAQIPVAGHYDDEKTIASFVGFAPANDPKFVMLVTLQEPKSSPWASETAAPLWFSIALDVFPYLGIFPN